MNIYQENGYKNREDYLRWLSKDFGVMLSTVRMLADMNGPSEDFDALPEMIEDYLDNPYDYV